MKQKIIDGLAKGVADTQVLWNKIHNLHWNVQGPQFRQIHEFTEAIYDEMAEQFDALAERILMLGAKPPVTLSDCLKLSTVKEEKTTSFSTPQVLDTLAEDLEALRASYKAIRSLAADSDDPGTDSLLTGFIEGLDKTLWMIRAST